MAVVISVSGVFPSGGVDTLYTCTNGRGIRLDTIRVTNNSASQITINLWIKHNSVDRRISAVNQQLSAGASAYNPKPIFMALDDSIEASSSDGPSTDFALMGIQYGLNGEI